MKYCKEHALALSAFVDGELTERERAALIEHMDSCEGCREHLAELMAMHAAFADLEEYDAPDGFAESVMERLHEESTPKKRTARRAWVPIAACAAIVLLAVGGPLRGQLAKTAVDCAVPETAALTMAEPKGCAEEEYQDECASLQSAPRTMMTMHGGAPSAGDGIGQKNELSANGAQLPQETEETGEADIGESAASANDAAFANEVPQLPRSVVFVYGAAHKDYLIESAASFDYYADGTVAGYDLPAAMLDEFLALLDADGLTYDSSVSEQADTFYVQYEEADANG